MNRQISRGATAVADITMVNDIGGLYDVINQEKSGGYLESEPTIISKSKLYLNSLHDSGTSLVLTSGAFSDKATKLSTGEDSEHVVSSRCNLAPDELEKYKQLILDDKMLVVSVRDRSSRQEILENNSAYEEVDITHFAEAPKGSKA